MTNFVVMGTWNTKQEELEFICAEIKRKGHRPIQMDLSTKRTRGKRSIAVDHAIALIKEKVKRVLEKNHVSGVIAIGGGTNLFMATQLMEQFPLFIPKIIVSSMIVNSVHSFRTYKDVIYVQSPCDFGIFNPLAKTILTNCVIILTSMIEGLPKLDQPSIAITGFGISDGYYEVAKKFWSKKGYSLVPFHAIGENTMAMGELIQKGLFKGILDLTLHDIMDHVAQGSFGKLDRNRLYAYLSEDKPAVIAPGGLDTVAFIPQGDRYPRSFRNREIYHHDFRVGLKAKKEEVIKAAKWIGNILKETSPKKSIFLIPLRGWSSPGEKGEKFYDQESIKAFRKWIRKFIREEAVIDVDLPINAPQFGRIACEHLYRLIGNER
jgi:uncharacterized protein (UPF0261 family)